MQKIPIIDIKKYGGKQVAIHQGKVIASAKTLEEIIKRIKGFTPSLSLKEIQVFSVPKTLSVIYYAQR